MTNPPKLASIFSSCVSEHLAAGSPGVTRYGLGRIGCTVFSLTKTRFRVRIADHKLGRIVFEAVRDLGGDFEEVFYRPGRWEAAFF